MWSGVSGLLPLVRNRRVGRPEERRVQEWRIGWSKDLVRVGNTGGGNALIPEADIAKVQEWLGNANVSTTRLYDRRKMWPEDGPTFRVRY